MQNSSRQTGWGNNDGFRRSSVPFYCGENNFSFSIQTIENQEENEFESDKPHRHSYFEIVWITSGAGVCGIDLERHTVRNDAIYLIPPGHIHFLQTEEHARGFVISFGQEFIHLASGLSSDVAQLKLSKSDSSVFVVEDQNEKIDMQNILACMKKEFLTYSLLRSGIMSGWLRIFLSYLNGLTRQKTINTDQSKNLELVKNFYACLEKDFLKKKMVVDYANDLFISPNYLNEIVKRVSGFTASHHIQQRIVLEAKRLAIYSTSSMKEIAYLLGFEDIAYFSKFFKTFSGSNFRDFKRSRTVCDA
jgi:AraC family transcriptional regulator, transcriptional activator of pobA